MNRHLATIAILVRDYDEALAFFVGKLHFELVEDTIISDTKRWIIIKPWGNGGANMLLEIRQVAGCFYSCTPIILIVTIRTWLTRIISVIRSPSDETYGRVVVFRDLYGNLWDLIGSAHTPGNTI